MNEKKPQEDVLKKAGELYFKEQGKYPKWYSPKELGEVRPTDYQRKMTELDSLIKKQARGEATWGDTLKSIDVIIKGEQLKGVTPTIDQEIKDYEAILRGMPVDFMKKPLNQELFDKVSKYINKLYDWKFKGLTHRPAGEILFEEEIEVPGYERKNK